jgi:DNA-directed RNA polymerase specialized sigma24 family protein
MPVLNELLEHRDFVRRLAGHLVCDEHRAEDVTQEVLVRALERPPQGRARLRGWFARVTRSVASNSMRGERSRRHHETEDKGFKGSPPGGVGLGGA